VSLKVLLVDDDEELLESLSFGLRRAGLHVLVARDPQSTTRLLRDEMPDCVVLDVDLGRWSGLDILREVPQESDVPVLMLTGETSDRIVELSRQLGSSAHLTKPMVMSELLWHIRWATRKNPDAAGISSLDDA
jgi:DNA-binding response OmpR family regulator